MNTKRVVIWLITASLLFSLSGCDLPFRSPEQPETPTAPSQTQETPPKGSENAQPETPTAEQPVTLYLPNGNRDGFVTMAALTDGKPEHIVSLLVTAQALPAGCELLDFAVTGNGACRADMNAAYLRAISEGTTAEYLRLGSLVNTLLTFFDLDEITVTIEGEVLETGHEIYDYPLRFYENQTADFGVAPEPSVTPNGGAEADSHPGSRALDYEVPALIQNLPRSDAVDCVWTILGGYWTAADNLFVAFEYQDDVPGVSYGMWESEGSGFGELINADPTSDYEAALTIRFPAREANEVSDARPETTVTVFIDVRGLEQDGKIRIKIESHGNGDWHTYAYVGRTSEEAYKSVR